MNHTPPTSLSDSALVAETVRAASAERRSTAELLVLLAEFDRRRLYLGQGYPSLFTYCTQALHLSEPSAYLRIAAARAGRRFPIIFGLVADGCVTVTNVSLLAPHLTDDNHEALLRAATHKSKREVEQLVACIDPQPDVVSRMNRIQPPASTAAPRGDAPGQLWSAAGKTPAIAQPLASSPSPHRSAVAPFAPDRYLLKITLSADTHAKLQRARDLLRHQSPNGDPAAIVECALKVLVEQLEKTKHAATPRPEELTRPPANSRHVPAAVKRAVWARDDGRCAFVGMEGRCPETGFLEFHHVVPFASGGPPTAENLQLRCRAHNAYEAERDFGTPCQVATPEAVDSVWTEFG